MSSDLSKRRKPYSLLTDDQLSAITHANIGDRLIVGKMGSGKTVVAATAIADQLQSGYIGRVLIVTTPRIADTVWQEEFDKWDHLCHIRSALASGSLPAKARLEAIDSDARVVITTFNLLPWFKEHQLFKSFDALVIDETTKLTAAGGKYTTSIKHAAKRMSWRLGLTGTPVSEGPDKLYTQLLLIDGGKAFGTRKESFLRKYFYPTDYQQRNWELKEHLKDAFYQTASHSIYTMPDYRHTLPQLIENTLDIAAPVNLVQLCSDFIKNGKLENMTSPTAGTDTQKLAQLACGFYYDDNQTACWISEFRIQAAVDLINQTNGNVLVVYNFIPEKERFLELCPQAETLTNENIARWNNNEIPVMLLHPASAGHGIELQQGGSTIIWLSNQWSLDKKEQLNARLWRRGQTENVYVFYFRALGIDDRMSERLEEKGYYDQEFNEGVE